jgi:Tfp pilus assembly protein PilF
MSLAILTTALAESVGLDVAYQRVNVAPVYRRYANVMTLSTHVRTHLFAEEEDDANEIVVLRSKIIIDYYPQRSNIRGDMISDGEFFAMYYRNLASDAIISGELDEAYKLMRQALDVAPTDAENLNTLAVLLNKMGHSEKAFELYAYAINEQQTALNLLSNYAQLLTKHGRIGEAQAIQASMQYVEDDNPYRWLDNAEYRIAQGQHLMARRMLERTLENAPFLHEAYFALAKSYYLTQEVEKADAALKRAAELAYLPETERLYEQKRSVLSLTEAD